MSDLTPNPRPAAVPAPAADGGAHQPTSSRRIAERRTMTDNIQTITPTAIADPEEARPVHIQYGDVKMDLPRLDDSANLPTSVIIVGLTAVSRGWKNLTQEEKINFMATILTYLVREYPLIERELDTKSGDKIADIGRIIDAWAQAGKTDPKA